MQTKKLELSEAVPVAGLVMARIHIYECECLTALDLWDDGVNGIFQFV